MGPSYSSFHFPNATTLTGVNREESMGQPTSSISDYTEMRSSTSLGLSDTSITGVELCFFSIGLQHCVRSKIKYSSCIASPKNLGTF